MRSKTLSSAMVAALAGLAGMGSAMSSATLAGIRYRDATRDLPRLTHRRNRTENASNRGIIARRKANKVARRNRVFNAQRARGVA